MIHLRFQSVVLFWVFFFILGLHSAFAQTHSEPQPHPPKPVCPMHASGHDPNPMNPSPGVVNLNTATDVELQRLPRIGPAKAKAIIALRSRRPFRNPWDIIHVKGIGRKTFLKLRPYLAVTGVTTLSSRPKLGDWRNAHTHVEQQHQYF